MNFDDLAALIQSGRTAFLVGAGISRQSGIPLVCEIERGILAALGIADSDAESYLRKKLPFEATIQAVFSHAKSDELFAIFAGNRPQRNHHLLARLAFAASGRVPVILTTNFDTLIEEAALASGKSFELIPDGMDLSSLPITSSQPRLVKLHGCITRPSALGTTIRAVANQQGVDSRKSALRLFLGGGCIDNVIVLGYSFSDKFDITPALNRLHIPVKFWVVAHGKSDTITLSPLADLPPNHPLRHYNGGVLNVHTDRLIEAVWVRTQADAPIPLVYEDPMLGAKLKVWRDGIEAREGKAIGSLIGAALLKAANCYEISNRYAEVAFAMVDLVSRPDHGSIIQQIIGDNLRDLHLSADAPAHLRAALRFGHQAGKVDFKAKALNSLGILLEDKAKVMDRTCESEHPHPPRRWAIKYYEQAAKWASAAGDDELAAKCHSNVGIAMKNVVSTVYRKRAFRRIHDALEVARRVGDQRSAARCYGMMASCLSLLGRKKSGIAMWQRALQISTDLADSLHIAIWTANMGEDYLDIDEAEATRHLNVAVVMFTELNIPGNVEYCSALLRKIAPTPHV